jgi:hypothetical protein
MKNYGSFDWGGGLNENTQHSTGYLLQPTKQNKTDNYLII